MPVIQFDVSLDTYNALLQLRKSSSWREFFLKKVGLDVAPRKMGRPKAIPGFYSADGQQFTRTGVAKIKRK